MGNFIEKVFKKNSLKPIAASHTTTSWCTKTWVPGTLTQRGKPALPGAHPPEGNSGCFFFFFWPPADLGYTIVDKQEIVCRACVQCGAEDEADQSAPPLGGTAADLVAHVPQNSDRHLDPMEEALPWQHGCILKAPAAGKTAAGAAPGSPICRSHTRGHTRRNRHCVRIPLN